MIDIQFLNQKATKLKSGLKNIKTIIDRGEDSFTKTPMYPDRTKYYLIIIYDILQEMACHILKDVEGHFNKESCLEDISKTGLFSEKINRILQDFVIFRKKLFEENFNYSDRELFHLSKNIVETLDNLFISELAKVVKELKEKAPKLKIPVNLVKINKNLTTMKLEAKRIETFKDLTFQEFEKDSFVIDRVRYFLTVYIDSALWICRHIARQMKVQDKRCFIAIAEKQIISQSIANFLQSIADNRDKLANPVENIDLNWLYDTTKNLTDTTQQFIKELSKSLIDI